jgi:hypothetical protein
MSEQNELRQLAELATPGPWDFDTTDTPFQIQGGEVVGGDCTGFGDVYTAYNIEVPPELINDIDPEPMTIAENISIANGRFIRAADPATIIRLLDRIEELERRVADERKTDEQIRDAAREECAKICDAEGQAVFRSGAPGDTVFAYKRAAVAIRALMGKEST